MIAQRVNRRLGNRKTTTGCITCKARRIKCGEEKPSCRRCTSTGRHCDGYRDEFHVNRSTGSVTLPGVPSPDTSGALAMLSLNPVEAQALQFFTNQAAVAIAGWTNVDFWTRTVPQLCLSQRAVQHAATAIGSLLLQPENSSAKDSGFKSDLVLRQPASRAFALDQYGKAIKETMITIRERRGDVGLAAVTCLLFVCIEALQGHECEAITIFHRGQTALQEWQFASAAASSINAELRPVFGSLGLQFIMFDHSFIDEAAMVEAAFCSSVPSLPLTLTSLTDAHYALLNVLAFVQNITIVASDLKWQRTTLARQRQFNILVERHVVADRLLQSWYSRFQEIVQCQRHDMDCDLQQKIGTSVLLQQYLILRIWLAGSLETTECFNDTFMPQFRTIVAEATFLAKFTSHRIQKTDFCMEMGTIPPLYWTVLKCRDPLLRRQALSLLIDRPRQEGLWDSRIVSKVGRRIIQLEEGLGEEEMITSNMPWELDTVQFPSEEKRVKSLRINLRTNLDGKQGDMVEIRTLPKGLLGGWHVRKEFITLEEP